MKKQLLFILLFLPAFLTAKEIRYFVQPGEILDLSENAFEFCRVSFVFLSLFAH